MKVFISDLTKKYNITRNILLYRLNYLKITPRKLDNRLFIDEKEVIRLDALNEYIKQHGKMDGFLALENAEIVDTSEAVEAPVEKKPQASESAIITTNNDSALLDLDSDEITDAEAEIIDLSESECELIDKNAQYKALDKYIISETLVNHYFETLDFNYPDVCEKFDKFKEEMHQQDKQKEVNRNPKKVAQLLMTRAKAKTRVKVVG